MVHFLPPPRHRRAATLAAPLLSALLAAACTDGPSAPPAPPTVTVRSTAGGSTLVSGSTLALVAEAKDGKGRAISAPAVTWSSSDPAVAAVAGGVVTGAKVGTATITAAISGGSGSLSVTVTPGVPAVLLVRTQPGGAAVGAPFATPAAVELRDAAGNLATDAVLPVTATLASGGGTLGGSATVTPTQGVAAFTTLTLAGTVGTRTLAFAAGTLAPVTSAPFALAAGAPARLALRTAPAGAASGAPLATQPVVEVRDLSDNLVSTASTVVTAQLASGGGTLDGGAAVTAVQGVATFATLGISGVTGPRTLAFAAPGLTGVTSGTLALAAGAPTQALLRTAPGGAGLNAPFVVQPVVELRDNAGNLATGASAQVTATITAGGGVLTAPTATAVEGVATFAGLGITGTPATRTLRFAAPGTTPATASITPCDPGVSPQLALGVASRALVGYARRPAVGDTVALADSRGSCTFPAGVSATVSYPGTGGWLAASTASAPLRLLLQATPGALNVGSYAAAVQVASTNAGTVSLPVTFDVRPSATVLWGTPAQRVLQLDAGGTVRPALVVRDAAGATVAGPLQLVTRAPTVATVAADGTITARAGGGTWAVASTTLDGGAADSLYVNVTRTTGPLLRTDLAVVEQARGTAFSVTVVLDTRGATIGAATVVFTWPNTGGTPGLLTLTNTVPGAVGAPVVASDAGSGTTRISIASAAGLSGVIPLARFDFSPVNAGSSQFVLRVAELLTPAQQSLLDQASALSYPLVIR